MSNSATTKRIKLNESENEDRLSDLPESVILHILSFLNTKHAVQTCVLSTRWKNLWKHLPDLILHCKDFGTLKIFTKFVSRVLSLRDSSIPLHSFNFSRIGCLEIHLLKRVVNYAITHNIQRLGLSVKCNIEQIPHSLFSCQTLTHLKLSVYPRGYGEKTLFPKSLNLPALTSLYLEGFTFCPGDNDCAEPFSAFNRLNSLFLCNCEVRKVLKLCISSATLVNFTLRNGSYDFYNIELCTPSLGTFAFIGKPYQEISGNGLSHVKHVDIDAEVTSIDTHPALILLSWLLGFFNTKSMTVTAATLQVISLYSDFLKIKLPSLGNLKSLKVKNIPLAYGFRQALFDVRLQKIKSRKEVANLRKSFKAGLEPMPSIPGGIVEFLLQNSPSAKVHFVDRPTKVHFEDRLW